MHGFVNTPFSYSVLDAFETCPRNFYWTRQVEKSKRLGEPYSPGKAGGVDVHTAMQNYVERGIEPPIGLRKFKAIVDMVTQGATDVTCEIKFGLRADLSPCQFFDADVCLRVQFDLNVVQPDGVMQLDYKTSSQPRESDLQLKLYNVAGLQRWPKHDKIWAAFVYTHHNSRKVSSTRADIPEIVAAVNPRLERLRLAREENDWPERPGWKCKGFCPVKQCGFWQPSKRG